MVLVPWKGLGLRGTIAVATVKTIPISIRMMATLSLSIVDVGHVKEFQILVYNDSNLNSHIVNSVLLPLDHFLLFGFPLLSLFWYSVSSVIRSTPDLLRSFTNAS